MTKSEIIKDLKSTFSGAGLIGIGQIAQYTSMHRNTVSRMLAGTDYFSLGKRKLYAVNDVAELIISMRNN